MKIILLLMFFISSSYFIILFFFRKRYLNVVIDKYDVSYHSSENISSNDSILHKISNHKALLSLKKQLINTGDTPNEANITISTFYVIHLLFFSITMYLLKLHLVAYIMALFISAVTTRFNIIYIIKKRNKIADAFSTDILAVFNLLLYSGFSIENSLSRVTDDIFKISKVAGVRFRQLNERISVVGLESALINFSDLWDERMLKRTFIGLSSFVKTGGSVTAFVSSEMERIAHEREAIIEVKVAKISSKLTLPMVVLIMFPSLGFMLSPAIAGAISVFTHL